MKRAQVNKLYKQLTPKEQADLAIDAIIRKDDDELGLIIDSVEHVTYTWLHPDYINRLQGFERVAAYYGVQHWKLQSEMAKPTARVSARLYALEQALISVCKTERINIDAVKWQACCNVANVLFSREASPSLGINELIDGYAEQFMIAWTGKISR